ncbi:MAG TPA: ABC transporter permease [Streptosporangiaceae bacterium]|nr:ABC transporter permease [Streptosporangiaceae bacterium]
MATESGGLTALPAPSGRAGLLGTLRSEFTKIRSVRSTYWTMLVLLVVGIGLGALITGVAAARWNQMGIAERATFNPTRNSLVGLYFGQFVIVVLGTLTITSEYSTGMIRTSLTAMPRRGIMYVSKAAVFTVLALLIGLITSFAAFFLGQALLASTHDTTTLSGPNVLRAVIGGGLFIAVCGLFAYGIGAILRHTAGAISTAIGLLFVLPIVVNFLPASWSNDILRWLPSEGGLAIWNTRQVPHEFTAWGEFGVFLAYTAAILIAGFILFRKRDA